MMGSTRYDHVGCSVEVAFGRRRAERDCGRYKEGYKAYVTSDGIQGVGVEVTRSTLGCPPSAGMQNVWQDVWGHRCGRGHTDGRDPLAGDAMRHSAARLSSAIKSRGATQQRNQKPWCDSAAQSKAV
eukprot:360473-Chlamydomonas_euryale.AAC.2